MTRGVLSSVPQGAPLAVSGELREPACSGLYIAQVIGHACVGGAERMVVNLLNAVAHARPILVLTHESRAHELLDQLDPRIEVVRATCRLWLLPYDIWRLAAQLRRRRINVLHCHMFWPNVFGALAARIAGVPVFVTTEHGRNSWKKPWHRWIERNLISRRAHLRICVSADIRDLRVAADGIPARKLIVLPNGTSLPAGRRRPANAVPRLLAVGRLIDAKDYPTLLAAARILRERGVDFVLQIAGDGPLRDELKPLCTDWNLDTHVQWLGTRHDVPALMADSDAFVMTSVREGQPMAVLEAMAAGMPIVATRAGGIPATVAHECEALLAAAGDAQAIATALERLIRDPDLAQALGARARRRAALEYSIEAAARRHVELYRRLLGGMRT